MRSQAEAACQGTTGAGVPVRPLSAALVVSKVRSFGPAARLAACGVLIVVCRRPCVLGSLEASVRLCRRHQHG